MGEMFLIFIFLLIHTQTHVLKSGENIAQILLSKGISRETVNSIVSSLWEKVDLRRCQAGDKMHITLRDGKFISFQYEQSEATWIVDSLYSISQEKERRVLSYLEGSIEGSSLYDAVLSIGGTPKLVFGFAEDVFPWDIDFNVETRKGDKFEILTTARYVGDRFIGYGRILYARYITGDKEYAGIYYPEGRRGYYDTKGKSLQRLFLKAPLGYIRISSKFTYSRFHPILRVWRSHYGIDYAAPTGTPVRTIGDGKVVFVGWRKGFGRQVIIQHSRGFKSYYGHLSKFKKGIKKDKYVKQGYIIGYVGSTGLSTGPHLDFRLKKHEKWINPLKLNPPSLNPLKGKELKQYKLYQKELFTLLKGIETIERISTLSIF